VDGALVAAHFQEPWEITGDGAGTLYVADSQVIRTIDVAAGTVTTLAGSYGHQGSADGVGTQATFNLPSGLAYANGQLYVSDTENGILRKIDVASSSVTTIAGAAGQVGYVDGPGADARFRAPGGIALDPSGKLYVSDTENNLIRAVDLTTGVVSTLAGGGPSVSALTDGIGTAAAFWRPKALRIDASGTLYVADAYNQAVRKVVPGTGAVSTLATFTSLPEGVAPVGSDVFVSLSGQRGEGSVVRVAPDGTVSTVAGNSASAGFVDGVGPAALFTTPAGVYSDGAGSLYIADSGNFVVRQMALANDSVVTYAGALSRGSADGTGSEARFAAPQGIALGETTAYVADTGNDTIRAVNLASGRVTTVAGSPGQAGHVDGTLADARFDSPTGIALDASAQVLYVGDVQNRTIRRIDLGKGQVTTPPFTNGPGFAGLDSPSGLAIDGARLFAADSNDDDVIAVDLVHAQFSLVAGQLGVLGAHDGVGPGATFSAPTSVAADRLGHLYVTDNQSSTLRRIDLATASVATVAGSPNKPGDVDGTGASAHFGQPFGVTANDLGDVFVADTSNGLVRHVDAANLAVTTVIGSRGLAGVKLGALPAQISSPSAVALTRTGTLLVISENAVLIAH
jgi:sugar lactone lactonase YvrE